MQAVDFGRSAGPGAIDARQRVQVSPATPSISNGATSNSTASNASAGQASPMVEASVLAAGEPLVDAGRVAAIRQAIESGAYSLNPEAIAERMIAAGFIVAETRT